MFEAPISSIWQLRPVYKHRLTLIHDISAICLTVTVELNRGSVLHLLLLLSLETGFNILKVKRDFFNFSRVLLGLPVVQFDLFCVIYNIMRLELDHLLSIFHSLYELLKDDSGCFNRYDLVSIDIDLGLVAFRINGRLINIELVDSLAKAFRCN